MSHHKIEIRSLYYQYPDGHQAIEGLSLMIHHGESVGIIGSNGAGKSTLLHLLMGLLFPTQGEIIVGDTRVTKKTLPLIRKSLGMVFQDSEDQLFMTRVYDDVAFGPRNYLYTEQEVEERVCDALERVGIPHLSERAPYKLSGGEKRCAAIASILSMSPDILIMDEPTASLDPRSRSRVIALLNSFDHTKLVTSHDLDMILDTCNRVIVIHEGKIAADGEARQILTNQEILMGCGLELPLSLRNCPICNPTR